MNPIIGQALCGVGGIVAGLLILAAFAKVKDWLDPTAKADRAWVNENKKAWKEYERRTKS